MQLLYKNNSIRFSETNKTKVLISALEITLGLSLVEVTGVATLCELAALNFSKSVTTPRLCSTVSVQNCLLDNQGSSLGEQETFLATTWSSAPPMTFSTWPSPSRSVSARWATFNTWRWSLQRHNLPVFPDHDSATHERFFRTHKGSEPLLMSSVSWDDPVYIPCDWGFTGAGSGTATWHCRQPQ